MDINDLSFPPAVVPQTPTLEKPQDLTAERTLLPVAVDLMPMFAEAYGPQTGNSIVAEQLQGTRQFRLRSGLRVRGEPSETLVQYGFYVRHLSSAALPMIRELATRPLSVDDLIVTYGADTSLIAKLCSIGVLVEVDSESRGAVLASSAPDTRFYIYDDAPHNCYAAPVTLELEITNKCFRTCSYCAYSSGPNPLIPMADEMPTEWWLTKVAEAAELGVTHIEFTGGDPLVRQDALEIISTADQLGIALIVNSDLSVLRKEDIERFRELKNLVAIQTSIDGADSKTCDRTRGRGAFKKLLEQLKQLKGTNLPVVAGTTVTAENYDDISNIAALANNEGLDGLYIAPMYEAGRGKALRHLVVNGEQWDTACRQFANAIDSGTIAPTHSKWYDIARVLLNTGDNLVKDQAVMTQRGDYSLRIDPVGKAYVSAKLREKRPRFASVGDLTSAPMQSIWHKSHQLNELRSYPTQPNVFGGLDVRSIPPDPASPVIHDLSRQHDG